MAKTKPAETSDEFCDDGKTRKLNRDRPYGTVYADGYEETKFVQDGIGYRGDGIPVGYIPAEERGLQPVVATKEQLETENEELRRMIASMGRRLEALEGKEAKAAGPAPVAPAVGKESTRGAEKRA